MPSLYLDEHIHPRVARAFQQTFRTIETTKAKRFSGRREDEYLNELYADNGIFVTSDREFIDRVLNGRQKHAGLIFVPDKLLNDEKEMLAWMMTGYIQQACSTSRFALRRTFLYVGHDGIHAIKNGKDSLQVSWPAIAFAIEG